MIGYTLKHVLDLVPEAFDLIKKANVERDYPIDNKDGSIACGLVQAYKTQIAKEFVEEDNLVKVANAIAAYGVKDVVDNIVQTMLDRNVVRLEKKASMSVESKEDYLVKQAGWEGNLTGFVDYQVIADDAEKLFEKAAELGVDPGKKVRMYSGNAYLSKEAALGALGARFYASGKDVFAKLAAAMSAESEILSPGKKVKDLCRIVSRLDKEAGLAAKGFNFYEEVLLEKDAALSTLNVNICGKSYPLDRVMNLPESYLSDYMGKDFAKELVSDPASAKAMVESLPMDSQQVLSTLLKSSGL